jgi:hypothetical protein
MMAALAAAAITVRHGATTGDRDEPGHDVEGSASVFVGKTWYKLNGLFGAP